MDELKIIPINRKLLKTLEEILKQFGERCCGPKEFNALFIDRKGFMKQGIVPNPPPPSWQFAIMPKRASVFLGNVTETPATSVERVEFYYYGRLSSGVLEYRE